MVTAAEIHRLARLHQRGVAGAGQQLITLHARQPDEFVRAARLECGQLDPVEDANELVQLVMSARQGQRVRGHQAKLDEARRRALELARHARLGADRTHLDPAVLEQVVSKRVNAVLVFDLAESGGAVAMPLLHRAFRACREAEVIEAFIADGLLHLHYETGHGTGLYRFVLHPVMPKDEVVVVPLRTPPEEPRVRVPPPFKPTEPVRPTFWDMMVDALARVA